MTPRICRLCRQPVTGPAYDARDNGYDDSRHCTIIANSQGRVVDCVMIARQGWRSCHRCAVYFGLVMEVTDRHGRSKEVLR